MSVLYTLIIYKSLRLAYSQRCYINPYKKHSKLRFTFAVEFCIEIIVLFTSVYKVASLLLIFKACVFFRQSNYLNKHGVLSFTFAWYCFLLQILKKVETGQCVEGWYSLLQFPIWMLGTFCRVWDFKEWLEVPWSIWRMIWYRSIGWRVALIMRVCGCTELAAHQQNWANAWQRRSGWLSELSFLASWHSQSFDHEKDEANSCCALLKNLDVRAGDHEVGKWC